MFKPGPPVRINSLRGEKKRKQNKNWMKSLQFKELFNLPQGKNEMHKKI